MASAPERPDAPDIPEQSWTNPFREGTYLYQLYDTVVRSDRDLVIIISDKRGRRGTGKTVASMRLADMMDRTPEGLTFDKCTLAVEELRNAYASQPPGSGLVLDEGEVGAGNRDAMTITNKALREIMSMGRVEQKYVVVNAPIKGFIDKDILKLADVWIAMERRGLGLVHQLKWEPYRERLYTEKKQRLEVKDIPTGTPLREVYNKLDREKRKHIDGEEGTKFIPQSEHNKLLQRAREDARRDQRNELIRDIYAAFKTHIDEQTLKNIQTYDGISQGMLADAVGLSDGQVSKIITGDA